MYHPLVASSGETGDLLDARLREGKAHTAAGGTEFVLGVLARVETHCCREAVVRMDAGCLAEELMRALEDRGTPFVAWLRMNAALDRLAEPAVDEALQATWDGEGDEGDGPRTWVWEPEAGWRAAPWSRARRVACVIQERPGEFFPHLFRLLTSMPADEMPAAALLALYRKRGKAEGHMGRAEEHRGPGLSSSPRPKHCCRGRPVGTHGPSAGSDGAFACNEVRLLVPLFVARSCTCCATCSNALP